MSDQLNRCPDCLPGQLNKRCSSADVLLIHLIDDEWIFNYAAAFSPSSPSSSHLCWSVQSGLTRGGEGEVRGDQRAHTGPGKLQFESKNKEIHTVDQEIYNLKAKTRLENI